MNTYNFSEDKESLLNTLTRFDGNISVEDVTDSGKTRIHSRHYHTFFLHVLLENLCSDIEPNEQKRELLFNEVCKRLSESKFLNESLVLDSLLPLRRKLAQQFFYFVKQIHINTVPDPTENSIMFDSFLEEKDFSTKLELQYRYEQNFDELEVIAKGGFGVVCKARHKVTEIVYAVKKIIFKYKSDSEYLKVIGEAKNIAALNHPNIVSYNNAWIECLPLNTEDDSDDSSSKSSSSGHTSSSDESDKIEVHMSRYSEALQEVIRKENQISSRNSLSIGLNKRDIELEKNSRNIINEHYSFNENSLSSLSIGSRTSDNNKQLSWDISETYIHNQDEIFNRSKEMPNTWDPNFLNVRVMLCIQMEFCDCDLRLWLDRRAEGQELPFNMDVMRIFKDILYGVMHIHSKNIIHRDLKPQNIFFSNKNNILKIGDFGLATLASCATDDGSGKASNRHSANMGTLPYAAPEQRKCRSYDSKVDMYSLGIILIELFNTFSTKMEFSMAIDKIHNGQFPRDMEKNWPLHINLVKNLIKKNPENRSSAEDILKQLQSLENSEPSEIMKLKVALAEKDDEIARLKALVKEQQSIINRHNPS